MTGSEPTRKTGRRSPARALTLVELLVTISMIALLAGLLLPQLGRGRDLAKLTICKTRLHNVGIGLLAYASTHGSFLPVGELLSRRVDEVYCNPQPELIAALAPDYVENNENFYCPSELEPEFAFTPANVDAGNIGYFYFSCRSAPDNTYLAQFLWRPGGVSWPRLLNTRMDPATWVMSDCWLSGEPSPHPGYKRGVNYLRLDGAVQMVQQQTRSVFK